jgi:methylisocitrate lyase
MILMGGYSISATRLGQPDVGFLTMSEMVSQIKIISDAVNVPLIADGDTGYGNPLNVMRTVKEYEKAGASGIILEDQQWPKRCGHMEGKLVISKEEHIKKLEAALEARSSREFIIIARTDSLAVTGVEDAVERGKAYRDAGADVVFIEAPRSLEELSYIRKAIRDVPLVANIIEGGKTPYLPAQALKEMGYEIMFCGLTAVLVIAKAFTEAMIHLKEKGGTQELLERMFTFPEFNELIGIKEFSMLETKFK